MKKESVYHAKRDSGTERSQLRCEKLLASPQKIALSGGVSLLQRTVRDFIELVIHSERLLRV